MAIQKYSTASLRTESYAGEIIEHAMATEVLTGACKTIKMPRNKSENLIVRSWVPYGATAAAPNVFTVSAPAHITQEGVTPAADTITPRDVTFTLNQYMCLYSFTDKQYDLHEDDIEAAMKEQVGERMGLVREMALYGAMKACTNKFYSGGTSRVTVDGKVTEKFLKRITRSLNANHAKKMRPGIGASVNVGTSPVETRFMCYASTDLEADIRDLPNFVPVSEYGSKQIVNEHEIGSWHDICFILSADLKPIADAGAAVSGLGLLSTTGTSADVYPLIVVAKDAFASVELRGRSALEPIWIPLKSSKSDPGGQRGYIGAKFWHTSGVLNNGWMAVGEVAASDLLE